MTLDKKNFESMRVELKHFEEGREKTIQLSREIITTSKQIIYSVHRGEIKETESLIKTIKTKIKNLDQTKSFDEGLSKVALQEYAEAITYYEFIKNSKIPTAKDLCIDIESYLLGLCDLTGELGRKAVDCAINKKFKDVEKIREFVDEIYGEFLKFDLRNGELRKKSDSIKWNLKKLEDLVLSIKGFKINE